jgi:hypothetical protein
MAPRNNYYFALLLSFIFVRLYRYVIMIVTFISIHLVIICVVLFGTHMRHTRLYPINLGLPHPIPGPAVLTHGISLGSYIVPADQHESFVRTLSSLMHTQENFPVGHPFQIAPSQAHLTWRFFRDTLPKKKMHLFGMDTPLILLSLGPGYHHPRGQDITRD